MVGSRTARCSNGFWLAGPRRRKPTSSATPAIAKRYREHAVAIDARERFVKAAKGHEGEGSLEAAARSTESLLQLIAPPPGRSPPEPFSPGGHDGYWEADLDSVQGELAGACFALNRSAECSF